MKKRYRTYCIFVTFKRKIDFYESLSFDLQTYTSHSKGWVFESQPRQTEDGKTGSDSSTTTHSATGASANGPRK